MRGSIKKFLRSGDPIYFVFAWFGLMALYTFLFYQLISGSPKDIRQGFSLVFGFIFSLYTLAQLFNWAKSKRRGTKEIQIYRCEKCGADNEVNDPRAPVGYKSAWTFIILPPLLSMYLSATLGTFLDLPSWQIFILCGAFVFSGFAIVRVFKLAPIDDQALESNPVWKRHYDRLEEESKNLVCEKCSAKLF